MKHNVDEPFMSILASDVRVRPADEPLGRVYDPGRDVAHLAEPLLVIALNTVDDDPEFRTLRATLNIPGSSLARAVKALVDFVELEDPAPAGVANHKPQSFAQHMDAIGWANVNPLAKMLLLSTVGELFLTAGWQGKRAASSFDAEGRRISKIDTGAEVAAAAADALDRLRRRGWKERARLAWRMLVRGR